MQCHSRRDDRAVSDPLDGRGLIVRAAAALSHAGPARSERCSVVHRRHTFVAMSDETDHGRVLNPSLFHLYLRSQWTTPVGAFLLKRVIFECQGFDLRGNNNCSRDGEVFKAGGVQERARPPGPAPR